MKDINSDPLTDAAVIDLVLDATGYGQEEGSWQDYVDLVDLEAAREWFALCKFADEKLAEHTKLATIAREAGQRWVEAHQKLWGRSLTERENDPTVVLLFQQRKQAIANRDYAWQQYSEASDQAFKASREIMKPLPIPNPVKYRKIIRSFQSIGSIN